ncbi:MAG: hypothetical protein JO271_18400 [Verrucomicrobia bacterium]|nr:hypothetical protein [Verrucomicrobiota bacterium]MBV9275080.1 hypothetical protein [Verrucomicrobiota bacterium]
MSMWSFLIRGRREAIGLLIGGGMAIICGVVFVLLGGSGLVEEYQFWANSDPGIAEVIGKDQIGQQKFYVRCRISPGGGAGEYEGRFAVYEGLWRSLRKGQMLDVAYLRTNPAKMRLKGSIGDIGGLLLYLAAGLALLGIGGVVSFGSARFLLAAEREVRGDQ